MALRPSSGREPACEGTPLMNTSKRATPLRPVTILPPSRAGSVTSTYFALRPSALDQRPRRRAADFLIGDIELGYAERRSRAVSANLPKRMVGEIGPALHVVDAGAERAVAFDLERQPLDESHRMHGIEMAQHQDSRRVLPP